MNKLGRADRIKASNARRKNRLVMDHKNQTFGLGLRNQHAVERIFVRQRQTLAALTNTSFVASFNRTTTESFKRSLP